MKTPSKPSEKMARLGFQCLWDGCLLPDSLIFVFTLYIVFLYFIGARVNWVDLMFIVIGFIGGKYGQ
jgi:hypothetical protein